MLSPDEILPWLKENVKGMRLSRLKTLAAIVPAAMELCGVSVHSLGRAMNTQTTAKHNIKRVERFLKNAGVECAALAQAIFDAFAPKEGPVLVLADWTDVPAGVVQVDGQFALNDRVGHKIISWSVMDRLNYIIRMARYCCPAG